MYSTLSCLGWLVLQFPYLCANVRHVARVPQCPPLLNVDESLWGVPGAVEEVVDETFDGGLVLGRSPRQLEHED